MNSHVDCSSHRKAPKQQAASTEPVIGNQVTVRLGIVGEPGTVPDKLLARAIGYVAKSGKFGYVSANFYVGIRLRIPARNTLEMILYMITQTRLLPLFRALLPS